MLKRKKSGMPFLLVVLLLIGFMPIKVVDAHSILEKATPNEGEQLNKTINSIVLTFSTKIENGSTLYLVNDKGEEIEPTSIDLDGDILEGLSRDPIK